MASVYPGALPSNSTKEDNVDVYAASHINKVQEDTVAIATELGTDVAGDQTDLKTRLSRSLNDSGGMRKGTSFPVSPTPLDGDFFYRTDVDTVYVYNGVTWLEAVSGPSALFSAYMSADSSSTGDLPFDTEEFDTASAYSSSTFTAPSAGKYLFTCSIVVDRNGSSSELGFQVYAKVNGSTTHTVCGGYYHNTGGTNEFVAMSGSVILNLSASDTVKMNVGVYELVASGSGSVFNIKGGSTNSRLTGCRLAN